MNRLKRRPAQQPREGAKENAYRCVALSVLVLVGRRLFAPRGEYSRRRRRARRLHPPNLSGFWNLDMKVPRDARLMSEVAPNTAFIDDTGPVELPLGNYGGLKPTPAALEKAKHWDPHEALTIENACRAPSIVYALQGPFPIEIFQSDVFIVMKLEYYDLVRIIFLDGRKPEPDYPHSMTGFSSGHWEADTLVVADRPPGAGDHYQQWTGPFARTCGCWSASA